MDQFSRGWGGFVLDGAIFYGWVDCLQAEPSSFIFTKHLLMNKTYKVFSDFFHISYAPPGNTYYARHRSSLLKHQLRFPLSLGSCLAGLVFLRLGAVVLSKSSMVRVEEWNIR